MRTLLICIAAALGAPATAVAAFAPPVSIPASGGEVPRALAFAGGRGVLVTQDGGEPYGAATQHAISIPGGRRQTFADTAILDSVARADGGVDLLVRRGSDPLERADITLRRVMPTGKIFDLWSVRTTASHGALARARNRTYVAWPEGSVLKLVSRPDGGIPTHPHDARIGLRGGLDVDLAVDARGRLVAATSTPNGGLVVAALRPAGTVLQRQVRRGVSGLVEFAVTSRGRVGLLVEDTGIEGEGGECVADRGGRHVRMLVRERSAARFGATQTIESPPFGCGSTGALLRALPSDGLAVVYQGGPYDHPPLLARAATAPRGRRSARPPRSPPTRAPTRRSSRATAGSSSGCCARRPSPSSSPARCRSCARRAPRSLSPPGPCRRRCSRATATAAPCSPGARRRAGRLPSTSRSGGPGFDAGAAELRARVRRKRTPPA